MEYKAENKTCQNCKKDFVIEPDDFAFYEKMKVPAPTFCPDCRFIRRAVWRNERTLYRKACDMCKKNIISIYSSKSPYTVYCNDCYHSDNWDALTFGREYDFSRPFFQQWKELFWQVPQSSVFNAQTVNSDYTQYTGNMKDGYLVSASWGGENIAYASRALFYSFEYRLLLLNSNGSLTLLLL